MTVLRYTIQSGNSAYKSSIISRDLTPARIQETWEKMRPENRYGQMTYEERLAFATSDEGKDYLFPYLAGFRAVSALCKNTADLFAGDARGHNAKYRKKK